MRPRYLEIEGLQSFKELQKVDFDKLSETGLFGIFGPTGSGKSSILDAITLALYGSVHRAAKGTQGIINTEMGGIKVLFTFDLTKEGVRKTYRVERLYKRKKDSENSAEAKVVRLFEVRSTGDVILADKHSDVNNFIIQLVGLKFEDFTRSVVLPQNKFQEFLLSPRGEKTKMLERIFYLEEYGRQLGDKVNRQMSSLKNKLSNIEGALSTLGISSPEALIEAERKMTETQKLKEDCSNKLKAIELRHAEGSDIYKLSTEATELQQQTEEYKKRQIEIDAMKEACVKSEKASGIKSYIDAYREAKKGYEEAQLGLNDANQGLEVMKQEKATVQDTYNKALAAKEQKLPDLIKHRTILQDCQTLRAEAQILERQLIAAREEYGDIKKQMEKTKLTVQEKNQEKEKHTAALQDLEKKSEALAVDNEYRKLIQQGVAYERELQGLNQNMNKHMEKCSQFQKNIEDYEKQYQQEVENINQHSQALNKQLQQKAKLELEKPVDRQTIADKQNQLTVIEGLLSNLLSLNRNISLQEMKLKSNEQQIESIQEETSKLQVELTKAVAQKEAKAELMKQKLQVQKQHTASLLAMTLVHGEHCPVCGATEHPHPAEVDHWTSKDEEELSQLQAFIDKDDETIKIFELNKARYEQQLKGIQDSKEQLQRELNEQTLEYKKYRSALPTDLQGFEHEALEAYIENEKQSSQSALSNILNWEQEMQQTLEVLRQHEDAIAEVKVKEGRFLALLENIRQSLKQEQQHVEELKETIEQSRQQHQLLADKLTVGSFLQELEKIAVKDEEGQKLTKLIKEQRGNLDQVTSQLQELLESINQINTTLAEKASEGKKLKEQKEEKDNKVSSIIGDKNLLEELNLTEKAIEEIDNIFKQVKEQLEKINYNYEEIERRRAVFHNSFTYFGERLQGDLEKLREVLKLSGFPDEESAAVSLLSEETYKSYQEAIAAYERTIGSMEDRMKAIAKLLGNRFMDQQQWQELCLALETCKTEMETSLSQYENARSSYLHVKSSFERWIQLQEELQAVSKKKDMLEQIQRLLKGNAFIEFISEERMRYIAREASETLGQLTKFKYAIELDTENGFVIRDNANGGVLRSVASLSGGETFLTSLSLALALSSQLQLKGQSPLEFFFLDEGFGTLDNTLLDTVIDSLERLSSSKRVIGLISHVPEMKSRIARRLIVDAPDRNGKGSRISIEKA